MAYNYGNAADECDWNNDDDAEEPGSPRMLAKRDSSSLFVRPAPAAAHADEQRRIQIVVRLGTGWAEVGIPALATGFITEGNGMRKEAT